MQLAALARLLGIAPDPAWRAEVTGVQFDSRETGRGDLFCCVPGGTVDGHDFAAAAAAAGAVALLAERVLPDLPLPQLLVPSARSAMGPVAAAVYGDPASRMRVVGITGTNGKTTTAYMVASILEAAGAGVGVTGTVETRILGQSEPVRHTTPEAPDVQRLLRRMLDAGCTAAVMEVSSHALDQGRVGGVHFAAGAFTNLTQDHLDYHGTMSAYFAAKATLFETGRVDVGIVNVDDPWGKALVEQCRRSGLPVVTFGAQGDVRWRLRGLSATSLQLDLEHAATGELSVHLPVGGRFNAANAACAATVAIALGVEPAAIESGLRFMPAVPGRFEPVDAGQDFGVLVDYAHTPDGVENVLRAARDVLQPGGRLLCVLGCGGDRDRGKRPLMGRAAGTLADHVVVTSDNPRSEDPASIIAEMMPGVREGSATYEVVIERRSAVRHALGSALSGDIVVIAGKGHERGQEIDGVVHPFDDRIVAREELETFRGGRAR